MTFQIQQTANQQITNIDTIYIYYKGIYICIYINVIDIWCVYIFIIYNIYIHIYVDR